MKEEEIVIRAIKWMVTLDHMYHDERVRCSGCAPHDPVVQLLARRETQQAKQDFERAEIQLLLAAIENDYKDFPEEMEKQRVVYWKVHAFANAHCKYEKAYESAEQARHDCTRTRIAADVRCVEAKLVFIRAALALFEAVDGLTTEEGKNE